MSATDKLRQLLDERGVEHEGEYGMVNWSDGEFTYSAANVWPRTDPSGTRLVLHMTYPTPEQAIAATLERGTSEVVSMRERDGRPYLKDELVCAKCGCQLAHEFGHVWQNFCPNCGAELMK